MREILFRGKAINLHNGSKDFVFGQYVQNRNGCFIYSDTWQNGIEKHQVIIKTIGQYTGLTDKNGKKIFEGDIVKKIFDKVTCIYWVNFDIELSAFIAQRNGGFCTLDDKFEVIGNIHDNPELLKEREG